MSLPLEKRLMYFLALCIPFRIILTIIPLYINDSMLPYYGVLLLGLSFSFLILYFNNLRMNAFEGGGKTWWANYRLLHGLLYLAAAIYAFQKKKLAWVPLAMDVLLGLTIFTYQHATMKLS